MRIDPDAPLTGEIEAGQLGAVRVGKVRTETPHSVHRTPGLIRRDSPENYRVVLAMAGTHRLAQDGRVALVHTGELAIYDFCRPYDLDYRSAVQLAVFTFPRALLPFPVEGVAALTAVPMAADHGTGAILPSLLRRVALDLDNLPPGQCGPAVHRAARRDHHDDRRTDRPDTPRKRRSRNGGPCCCESTRSSSSTWLTRTCRRRRSPLRTTSPAATYTGCSHWTTRRWPAGSGSAGSSAAARI